MTTVLILGSGPNVVDAQIWPRGAFDHIVAINNAWRARPDWTHLIFPDDFPTDKWPDAPTAAQRMIRAGEYVPANNAYGGILYAGGTMAFTAGYWALHALKPTVMGFIGCDMVYAKTGNTHFYGKGEPDPLRTDITLRSLEAKATRLRLIAARDGCAVVNLSEGDSRLTFPRATLDTLLHAQAQPNANATDAALGAEADLDYVVPSGKYWKIEDTLDPTKIDRIDALWRRGEG